MPAFGSTGAPLPRYLRVAIALSSAAPVGLGCGASNTPPSTTPTTSTSASASTSASDKVGGVGIKDDDGGPVSKVDDYTGGGGPCRCSWDTNTNGAPRVCKKGETAYNGAYCAPRKRYKYPPVIGPLDPPDMPLS